MHPASHTHAPRWRCSDKQAEVSLNEGAGARQPSDKPLRPTTYQPDAEEELLHEVGGPPPPPGLGAMLEPRD